MTSSAPSKYQRRQRVSIEVVVGIVEVGVVKVKVDLREAKFAPEGRDQIGPTDDPAIHKNENEGEAADDAGRRNSRCVASAGRANTCVVCPDCVGPTRKGYEQCQREAAALIQGRVIGFVIFGFVPWLLIAYFAYCAHGRANELRAARRPERPRGASASTATVTAVPVPTGVPVLTVSGSCGGGVALTAVVAPAPLQGTPVSTVPS